MKFYKTLEKRYGFPGDLVMSILQSQDEEILTWYFRSLKQKKNGRYKLYKKILKERGINVGKANDFNSLETNSCPIRPNHNTFRKKHIPCEKCEDKKMQSFIKELIRMGFGQSSAYRQTPWKYATLLMEYAVFRKYVKPHNFGRGKGKYDTDLPTGKVVQLLVNDKVAVSIARRYYNYKAN